MCNAFQPYESYKISELIHQLGALYDKERDGGTDSMAIKEERQRVSARLFMISAKYELKRRSISSLFVIRES